MAGEMSSLVLLVLSSCMLVGGEQCSLTTGSYSELTLAIIYLSDVCSCFVFTSTFMHAVTRFHFCNVKILSAESVDGSTPGVRVTWRTTVPPGGIKSVRVEFRKDNVVANYKIINASQTEVIQTGLQCGTYYHIRVVVTGEITFTNGSSVTAMLSVVSDAQVHLGGKKKCPTHLDVQVLVGGKNLKKLFCMLILNGVSDVGIKTLFACMRLISVAVIL